MEKQNFNIIGTRADGCDEKDKVLGNVVYAEDYIMPDTLYCKVFRSAKASAMIKKLNIDKAKALDGVSCVLTHEDVPNNESAKNVVGQTTEVGLLEAKQRILATDRVRYYGEPIVVVAAETPELARDALELIEIEYEELPGVFDPEEAMKPDAPKIHGDNNVIANWALRKGDVEKAFAESDVVVEAEYRTPRQEHAHMEPESGLAWVDDMGVINIRYSTQVVEHYRDVAAVLGIPESRVRTIGTIIGGGFGGKEDLTVEVFLALCSWNTKRPVKMAFSREEMGFGRQKRHPYVLRYKTGATKDGKLTAMQAELISDSGAYVMLSPWVLLYSTVHSTGPYFIPNVKVDAYSVLTNNIMTSAFRGFGGMQVAFAYESQMDALAIKLNMDPVELRKKNFFKRGDETANFQSIPSEVMLDEAVEKAVEALGPKSEPSGKNMRVGRGFACSWQSYGRMTYLHDTASSWVGLEMDGSAVVRCGIPDLGGGQRESIRAIAAELLGIPLDEVHVISTDSQVTPLAGTVTATRALFMSGNATKLAAENVREVILEKAADMLETAAEDLDIENKMVYSSRQTDKKVELVKVIRRCAAEGISIQSLDTYKAAFTDEIKTNVIKDPVYNDWTFGTQAVEVEVDTETGKVNVLKHVSVQDVGRAINIKRTEGQMEGGAAQGLGFALMEDYLEVDGVPITWNLTEYLVPTSKDIPDSNSIILESRSGKGPFGAKGIGEPSITAAAPAVANAIRDAVGIKVLHLPATPERVFWELQKKHQS
ncbi:MAG: xanthine dehydrogenase family protein molybdopterin-binding subunit [Spirochaetia bacterium]|nr:xanthine dehydrogenase family protein molybdopterin-binding subunit [Spirochaetia bacterium]